MKFLLALSIFVFSGCTLLNMAKFKKPEMNLKSIKLEKFSFEKMDLIFSVEVKNPNDFDIDMKSLSYEVEMNEQKIATQNVSNPVKVEALKTSTVELPLSVNMGQIFSSIGGLLQSKESTYKISGSAQFGFITLPFSETGFFIIENGQLTHRKYEEEFL